MAKQKNTSKTPKQKTSKRSIINAVCIVFLSLCVIGSSVAFVLVQNILGNPKISEGIDKLTSNSSSLLYDRDGEVYTTLSGESGVRENIKYDEMPQVVIDAFLSIEDSRFFKHSGFDLPRFISSGWANIVKGGIVQGGSTLTMQLVDVKLFPEAQTTQQTTVQKLEQKVVEIFKSMDIESKIDKEKIIELYLNSINFGGPARGIQKGAQYYFGKDAKNLTLTEAAFLSGVINAPGAYNPYTTNLPVSEETPEDELPSTYYEKATSRRNAVLRQMKYHGYITEEEMNLGQSSELALQLNGEKQFATEQYQGFVDQVVKEVREKTGKDPYLVPMKIYTSMDRDAQNVSDALLNGEGVTFPDERMTTGFTAIDNQTGEILAIGPGRSYSGNSRQSHATEFVHQIGSTAKPIVEYAQAFEYLGYSTEHVFEDSPVAYTDANTTLMNADRTFHGDVTFKQAVGASYNIPAFKTLKAVVEEIGINKEVEILNKLGIENLENDDFAYGMAIGGDELAMTPLQLASAYSVFANEGTRVEPYCVTKIDFEDDSIKDYEVKQKKINVFSDETAYLMSQILRDVVTGGYGTVVGLNGPYPVYAKSGTTDAPGGLAIPEGMAKDKWMAAYTNKYSVATWVGYEEYESNPNNYFDQNKLYANIEGIITRALLDSLTDGQSSLIPKPDGVVSISHVQGVFPYASSSTGKTVTGLIRKKFAKLSGSVNLTPEAVDDLDSLDVSLNIDNLLSIKFPQYSSEGGAKKTVKVGSTSFSFTPMFNTSSITGGIVYKYEISVNGTVVDSGASEGPNVSKTISSSSGDKVKVCGYYAYAKVDGSSNKVCREVESSAAQSFTIGTDFANLFASTNSFSAAKSAVESWASQSVPGVLFQYVESPNAEPGKLDTAGTNITQGSKVSAGATYIIAIGKDK